MSMEYRVNPVRKQFLRAAIIAGLSGLFVVALLVDFRSLPYIHARQQPQAERPKKSQVFRSLPVTVRQLEGTGRRSVTLTCENAMLRGTGEIQQLRCNLQNNANAAIVAGTLHVLTTIEVAGKADSLSSYDTFDMLLHPDFLEEKKKSFIQPGSVFSIEVTPADYLEAEVKNITVEIDFIKFLDGSGVGSNHAGSQIVDDMRAGAAKYKVWLAAQYSHDRSIAKVKQFLENETLTSAEIGAQNDDQLTGANMYRKYVRRVNKLKPSDDFLKHLMDKK